MHNMYKQLYKQCFINFLGNTSIKYSIKSNESNESNEPFDYVSFRLKIHKIFKRFSTKNSKVQKQKYEESFVNDIYKLKIYTRINKCLRMKKQIEYRYDNYEIQKIIEDIEFLVKKYKHQHFQTKPRLHRQSTIENCNLDFFFRLNNISEDLPVYLYHKLMELVAEISSRKISYSLN